MTNFLTFWISAVCFGLGCVWFGWKIRRRGTETQWSIARWQRATFPSACVSVYLWKLAEEVRELFEEYSVSPDVLSRLREVEKILHEGRDVRRIGNPEHLADELADVAIVTAGIAGLAGVDLEESIGQKMQVNRARVWAGRR